jgi:ribonuclease E
MSKKMLIDASHPEETRVVIVDHNRVEELDFESRHKRQLRGNVYLARVTRVEPSLQAAFIEYGGNRHGFLAFSEIHPDYYQIPYEDRMAILEAEEEDHESEDDDEVEASDEDTSDEERDENVDPDAEDVADENDAEVADEQAKVASTRRKRMSRRRYKIQEVIKRGQILLVQAVKEERGNKGAAMTTYLSLAGRYCVLMPNTPRGGGISRKIANGSDRKRLKSVMSELEVPQGMGVIVRTAGAKRTKAEIKRDYEYLSRLWSDIREMTLKSIAPALIHEEGNLVKRSIRDLYNKDIDEVLVEGEDAYKTAKAFIKMLMPSHAKHVKQYKESIPLFLRYGVERQIENSLSPLVQLKSGGYLVIHPTEALVSVDVNSGRSTKERNVERTALKTNIEAAEEVARQMRLRDLAGLIVIDFIDMDEHKNNRAVERKMKEALTQDRARIQTSRISQFGLMEISRQRRRRSLLEGSTTSCPHCEGVGRKRTVESSALAAIRSIEETAVRGEAERIRLKVSPDVAFYLINEKRDLLTLVDRNGGVFTEVLADEDLIRPHFEIEIVEKKDRNGPDPLEEIEKEFRRQRQIAKNKPKPKAKETDNEEDSDEDELETSEAKKGKPEGERTSKRRSRRGRRGGRGRSRNRDENGSESEATDTSEDTSNTSDDIAPEETADEKPKSRRRRKRKAPGRKPEVTETASDTEESEPTDTVKEEPKSRSTRRRRAPSKKAKTEETVEAVKAETTDTEDAPSEKAKPSSKGRRRAAPKRKTTPAYDVSETIEEAKEDTKADAPKRRRRAPAKKTNAADEKAEPKAKRTRKAPVKKASISTETEGTESSKKAASTPRRRAAPKKPSAKPTAKAAATKKAPARKASAETPKEETEASKPATSSRRRAAPARKPAPEKPSTTKAPIKKAAPKKAATKKATTKNAPAKKAAPKAKPVEEKTQEASPVKSASRRKAPAKKAVEPKSETAVKAAEVSVETPKAETASTDTKPAKKKRSWFGLKKKD